MAGRTVILANLGTPAAPTAAAVGEFLEEFLLDPFVVDLPRWLWKPILFHIVAPRRAPHSAKLYAGLWTAAGSPLDVGTRKMASALGARLGRGFTVDVAYRYGAPSVGTAMRRAAASGTDVVCLVPLFPQRTGSTTGSLIACAEEQARCTGLEDRFTLALPAPDAGGYVEALADRLTAAVSGASQRPEHLVVSFHGIPVRYDRREGGAYRADCAATAAAMLRAAGWPAERATVSFQSRFGPGAWLRPATANLLVDAPRRGIRRLAVATPGFLTDGLETVEEVGVLGRAQFLGAGGETFVRVAPVEDHPAMIEELAALVAART